MHPPMGSPSISPQGRAVSSGTRSWVPLSSLPSHTTHYWDCVVHTLHYHTCSRPSHITPALERNWTSHRNWDRHRRWACFYPAAPWGELAFTPPLPGVYGVILPYYRSVKISTKKHARFEHNYFIFRRSPVKAILYLLSARLPVLYTTINLL